MKLIIQMEQTGDNSIDEDNYLHISLGYDGQIILKKETRSQKIKGRTYDGGVILDGDSKEESKMEDIGVINKHEIVNLKNLFK